MTKIFEKVKVGDPVVIVGKELGPDGFWRTVRKIDYVTKVFKRVLQTRKYPGVQIGTGTIPLEYGGGLAIPVSDADVANVLREIEDRKRADAEYKAKQEAEYADRRRREKLASDILDILYRHVPENVLVRALAVLRGEA